MSTRTKWAIAATLLLILYGLGVVWWWNSLTPNPSYDPALWREYKATRIQANH